jgi:hypothetical protein
MVVMLFDHWCLHNYALCLWVDEIDPRSEYVLLQTN